MYKRLPTIDRATMFKAVYAICLGGQTEIEERKFNTIKALNQWIERNDCFVFMLQNKYALIDGVWEQFTTIGKKTITLNELKNIINRMEDEIQPSPPQEIDDND